ncbi:uncharacterized protein LOC122498384 [Leptopilina heterotoma]|uniref:uncharacterized protein LOC122498384 n=1 Tax=Leptopilina heterotoma TaxID=63436 RepID=UPI001CAA27B7|nr:uncharacterized protein LOC122498384 [Leptopilina heterotoma]
MNLNYEDDYNFDKMIKPLMMVSKMACFWPLSKESVSMEKKFRTIHRIIGSTLLLTMSIGITADGFRNRHNFDEVIECGLFGCAFYLATLRIIIFYTHDKEVFFIVENMRNDWCQATPEVANIFKNKCKFSYKIVTIFIISVLLALSCLCLLPIRMFYFQDGDREKLPLRGYYYFNHTTSPIFECALVFNIFSAFFGSCTITSATGFTIISVIHGAAKFSVLQDKFRNLKIYNVRSKKIVKECIVQHQACIRYADQLEKVISPLALGHIIVSTSLICFSGFQLTSNASDRQKLMKYGTFLQSAIFELFLFSYSGDQLMEESIAVRDGVYSSDWAGCSSAKELQIVMMRINNPSKITAAKFYNLTLTSFSKVLYTSLSYLRVLQAVNE